MAKRDHVPHLTDQAQLLVSAIWRAAVEGGSWSAAAALLRRGAPVPEPQIFNLAKGPAYVLELALKAGAPVHPREGGLPLLTAVGMNLPENVRALLQAGADPNRRDSEAETAMIAWAGGYGGRWTPKGARAKSTILRLLLRRGARLRARGGMEQFTPFWRTLFWHMISNDANGSARPPRTARQFHRAYYEMAMMLLRAGADPNERYIHDAESANGRLPARATPLFIRPFVDGRLHLALLRAGADPHTRDAEGRSALDFAREYGEKLRTRHPRGAETTGGSFPELLPLFPDRPAIVQRVIAAMERAPRRRRR